MLPNECQIHSLRKVKYLLFCVPTHFFTTTETHLNPSHMSNKCGKMALTVYEQRPRSKHRRGEEALRILLVEPLYLKTFTIHYCISLLHIEIKFMVSHCLQCMYIRFRIYKTNLVIIKV